MSSLFAEHDNTVQILRRMALDGKCVSELVEFVFCIYNLQPNKQGLYPSFAVWNCLLDAFYLTMRELEDLAGWHKFHKPGYTDEELEARLMPLIKRNAYKWTKIVKPSVAENEQTASI